MPCPVPHRGGPAGQPPLAFRYVLDGELWENDWAADDYLPNSHGADDSVVDDDPPIPRPSRWPRSPPADEAGNAGGVDPQPRWVR